MAAQGQDASQKGQEKEPRDLRLRNQYFPGAEKLVFITGKKASFRSRSSCAS